MKEPLNTSTATCLRTFAFDDPGIILGFFSSPARSLAQFYIGPVTRRKLRDETRSRQQLTRRDETRDGLVPSVSRPKVTRRDEIRDIVNKNNFASSKNLVFCFLKGLFLDRDQNYLLRPSRGTKSRDETRSRWSRLVSSRLFSRRDRLVTGPSFISIWPSRALRIPHAPTERSRKEIGSPPFRQIHFAATKAPLTSQFLVVRISFQVSSDRFTVT